MPALARADDDAPKPPAWLPEDSIGRTVPGIADPTGLRQALWTKGIKFQLNYIEEVIGVVNGGINRRTREGGRLEFAVDADLEKLFGWKGATVHANMYSIHGYGTTPNDIDSIAPSSSIEATPATRLFEAWIEQKFFDDKASIRVGQLAADSEFLTSNYAGLFASGTFGWATLPAADLPSGGPAYPLATPAVRLSYAPTDSLKFLLGIFNGDPAGPGIDDPQKRNNDGLSFRLRDPALIIGEMQYTYGDAKSPQGLSGTFKLGAYGHLGKFDDYRFDTNGVPLASPASNGVPYSHRGDQAIYAVLDQQVYRLPGDDPTKGIGVFGRFAVAPADRNLVDFYADGGINFSGILPIRPDDSFGVAVGYTHISNAVSGFDQDTNLFTGVLGPVQSSEIMIEGTYSAQIVTGLTFQPYLQYIVRPSGGEADPNDPTGTRRIGNATVVGFRTTLKY